MTARQFDDLVDFAGRWHSGGLPWESWQRLRRLARILARILGVGESCVLEELAAGDRP